jgi:hypothetical protein
MAAAFRVECDDLRVWVGKHVSQKLLENVPEAASTVWWDISLISVALLWPSAYKNERKSDPRAGLQVVAGGRQSQRRWLWCWESWGSGGCDCPKDGGYSWRIRVRVLADERRPLRSKAMDGEEIRNIQTLRMYAPT